MPPVCTVLRDLPIPSRTGVASYGASGARPPFDFQLFTAFWFTLYSYKSMKAISHVRCLQDFAYATVIKISLFFIISKKLQGYIGFFVTQCSAILCYCTCVTSVISMYSLVPFLVRAKSWRRHCGIPRDSFPSFPVYSLNLAI